VRKYNYEEGIFNDVSTKAMNINVEVGFKSYPNLDELQKG